MPLAPLTTLRVGPVARRLVTCTTTEQVVAALRGLRDEGADPLVLAGGSNVVIADDLTDLTVVRLANAEITVDGNMVRAEAGAEWDDVVVQAAIGAGLGGLECLSGIPGSAGATPVQNVGAYGAEVADTITRVRLLDRRTGEDALGRPRPTWASATAPASSSTRRPERGADRGRSGVRARRDGPERAAAVRRTDDRAGRRGRGAGRPGAGPRRRAGAAPPQGHGAGRGRPRHLERRVVLHQPRGHAANGSRNCRPRSTGPVPNYPAEGGVKLAAGWLVERAGFGKGFPGDGAPARLSAKHALALTNRGTATSGDVDRPGAPGPRRGGRRVRHPTGARTGADRRCDLILRI